MKQKLTSAFLMYAMSLMTRTTSGLGGYETSNPYKENNTPEAKGLKRYSCNGKEFFAHNEREAIKRAKQRGLWRENAKISLV